MSIYLIEKAWSDSMENEVNAAFGYKPHGYVFNEAEAQQICETSPFCTKETHGWAAPEWPHYDENFKVVGVKRERLYRYSVIPKLSAPI